MPIIFHGDPNPTSQIVVRMFTTNVVNRPQIEPTMYVQTVLRAKLTDTLI